MSKSDHLVDIIVDGRKISTQAKELILRIDGKTVYRHLNPGFHSREDRSIQKDLKIDAMRSFLNAAGAAFGHTDRFRIVKSLSESPRTFTEIKKSFDMTSPTADYHLKKLSDALIVFKDESRKYSLTLLGELVLDYFSDFMNEAEKLQETLKLGQTL